MVTTPRHPTVEVHLGSSPIEHRVIIDGKDLTHIVQAIEIRADAFSMPTLKLEILGIHARVMLEGEAILETLFLHEVQPKAEPYTS